MGHRAANKESTGKAGGFAVGDSPTLYAPIGGDPEIDTCCNMKSLGLKKIPPTPLSERGALPESMSRTKKSSSPFVKGDRGGFC